MEWVTLVLVPLLAAAGALGGSFVAKRAAGETETMQTLLDLDHRLYSTNADERRGALAHLNAMLDAGELNKRQRAFARTAVQSYSKARRLGVS
jgi:hypothetical protein